MYISKIWKNSWLTNDGELLRELEQKLEAYLGVKHCVVVSNGTIALQLAIKALGIRKEIITTPYSYVATTNSILWENCNPVFVDINDRNFVIDATLIEKSITEKTEAILATHCYGIPCDTKRINEIASKYNLKVIYDAAHSFKVENNGASILNEGNLSTLSFHATKLFHTVEGGAIICHDDVMADKIRLMRSFGHIGDEYYSLGINGKNSEFHAAMGLSVLPHVQELIEIRKELVNRYNLHLRNVNLFNSALYEDYQHNYSYYPFVVESEEKLIDLIQYLNENSIFPRRYFFPSLNILPHHKGVSCPVSESISRRVICLPLHHELLIDQVDTIANLITNRIG